MKLLALPALVFLAIPALAQHDAIRRVDLTPSGEASLGYVYDPVVTSNGEFVLFRGTATDLMLTPPVVAAPSLPVGAEHFLYRYEVRTRQFVQVNLGSQGQALRPLPLVNPSTPKARTAISGDGNLIVFSSADDDPGLGDANGDLDVFLYNVASGTTELISTNGSGSTPGPSKMGTISDDGRYVSFVSASDQLVPGLSGGQQVEGITGNAVVSRRVYVRDRMLGTTTLISAFNGGINFDESAYDAVLSPTGNKLVYTAVLGPMTFGFSTPELASLHVVDLATGARQTFGPYQFASFLSASHAAEKVCFLTLTSFVPADTGVNRDAYVLNTMDGSHRLATSKTGGAKVSDDYMTPSISGDGRFVAFLTDSAKQFFPLQQLGSQQVFVKGVETDLTTVMSSSKFGAPGLSESSLDTARLSPGRALNGNGDVLVFSSSYDNLPGNNVGGNTSLYLYERRFGDRDLTMTNLVAGQSAQIQMSGMTPNGLTVLGVSFTGQGPLPSYWGPLELSPPITQLFAQADGNGDVQLAAPIAPGLMGVPVFARGLDFGANLTTPPFFGVIQ